MQASLKTYNYFDNVWQFELSDAKFRLTPKAGGSLGASAPRISCDKVKVVCVDSKYYKQPKE
jgi:hypothetical protein